MTDNKAVTKSSGVACYPYKSKMKSSENKKSNFCDVKTQEIGSKSVSSALSKHSKKHQPIMDTRPSHTVVSERKNAPNQKIERDILKVRANTMDKNHKVINNETTKNEVNKDTKPKVKKSTKTIPLKLKLKREIEELKRNKLLLQQKKANVFPVEVKLKNKNDTSQLPRKNDAEIVIEKTLKVDVKKSVDEIPKENESEIVFEKCLKVDEKKSDDELPKKNEAEVMAIRVKPNEVNIKMNDDEVKKQQIANEAIPLSEIAFQLDKIITPESCIEKKACTQKENDIIPLKLQISENRSVKANMLNTDFVKDGSKIIYTNTSEQTYVHTFPKVPPFPFVPSNPPIHSPYSPPYGTVRPYNYYYQQPPCTPSSYQEQKSAEEKRRKEQREVLRRQAAELMQTGHINAINTSKSVHTSPLKVNETVNRLTTPERQNSSHVYSPTRIPFNILEQKTKQAAEDQRRKEQREVLKHQVADLAYKKEAEKAFGHILHFPKRDVAMDAKPAPGMVLTDFNDDQHRKDQREILLDGALELSRKKGTGINLVCAGVTVECDSPVKAIHSTQIERYKIDEHGRKIETMKSNIKVPELLQHTEHKENNNSWISKLPDLSHCDPITALPITAISNKSNDNLRLIAEKEKLIMEPAIDISSSAVILMRKGDSKDLNEIKMFQSRKIEETVSLQQTNVVAFPSQSEKTLSVIYTSSGTDASMSIPPPGDSQHITLDNTYHAMHSASAYSPHSWYPQHFHTFQPSVLSRDQIKSIDMTTQANANTKSSPDEILFTKTPAKFETCLEEKKVEGPFELSTASHEVQISSSVDAAKNSLSVGVVPINGQGNDPTNKACIDSEIGVVTEVSNEAKCIQNLTNNLEKVIAETPLTLGSGNSKSLSEMNRNFGMANTTNYFNLPSNHQVNLTGIPQPNAFQSLQGNPNYLYQQYPVVDSASTYYHGNAHFGGFPTYSGYAQGYNGYPQGYLQYPGYFPSTSMSFANYPSPQYCTTPMPLSSFKNTPPTVQTTLNRKNLNQLTHQPFIPHQVQSIPLSKDQVAKNNSMKRRRDVLQAKNILSFHPLIYPSPFAATYCLLDEDIYLVKRPEESFGVTISLAVESTLAPLPQASDKIKSPDNETKSPQTRLDGESKEAKIDNENKATVLTALMPEENKVFIDSNAIETFDVTKTVTQVGGETHSNTDISKIITSTVTLDSPKTKRRPRRKRVFFSAMTVVDASVQNARRKSLNDGQTPETLDLGTDDVDKQTSICGFLQKGDILLSINGHSTSGLTFAGACELFKGCVTVGIDGVIRCTVKVARLKPPKVVPIPIPAVEISEISTSTAARLPLQQIDFITLATSTVKAVLNSSRRILGSVVSSEELRFQLSSLDFSLTKVPISVLQSEWENIESQTKNTMMSAADEYWKKWHSLYQFENEQVRLDTSFLSEAKLCTLRSAPRPLNGFCKCGSQVHKYVNDPNCFLYSNLRALENTSEVDSHVELHKKKRGVPKSALGELNVMEKAFKDRFLRMKTELDAEESEAKFVDKMETIQIFQCNQAVFAPSLEAIVLSAVVEIGSKKANRFFCRNTFICPSEDDTLRVNLINQEEENESDDDDVPLALLGSKRKGPLLDSSAKKNRREFCIRFHFLAELVRHISGKWGHVYREPSHAEYAWRWEVFHGQNSLHGSKWAAGSKNPREVNSLSLENARFLLDDKTVAGFEHSKKTNTYYNAISCLAYILSPEQTGICDELLALLHADILTIDENQGIPILSNDWHVKVDALLLNDMHVRWGRSAEKYGIIEEIGKLQEFWKLNEVGWMLRDEDEVIFSLDDIDEWREAFEQKHQAYSDGLEGIGRFY